MEFRIREVPLIYILLEVSMGSFGTVVEAGDTTRVCNTYLNGDNFKSLNGAPNVNHVRTGGAYGIYCE